jgi:signal peptidase I
MSTKRSRTRLLFPLVGGIAASLVALAGARRWLDVVAVRGSSMAPALLPGDLLIVERWSYERREPRPGEVVLAADPRDAGRELVKRVAAVRDGRVTLHGDGAASTDSRSFGDLPVTAVRWRAAFRYWPPARLGPLAAHRPERSTAGAAPGLDLEPSGGEPACSAFGDLVVAFDDE